MARAVLFGCSGWLRCGQPNDISQSDVECGWLSDVLAYPIFCTRTVACMMHVWIERKNKTGKHNKNDEKTACGTTFNRVIYMLYPLLRETETNGTNKNGNNKMAYPVHTSHPFPCHDIIKQSIVVAFFIFSKIIRLTFCFHIL